MDRKVLPFLISSVLIVSMLGYHLYMLVKISEVQRDIIGVRFKVSESRKQLYRLNSQFEKEIDYKRIRKKAEEKYGMEISDSIEYFKID